MERFLRLINDPSPGFICRVAGRAELKPAPATIRVSNKLQNAATPESLLQLPSLRAESVGAFYTLHDGVGLFIAPFSFGQTIPAFVLYPISAMLPKTAQMRIATGMAEDEMYDFQKNGVAIGEICGSRNYFVMYKGVVYHSNHDGGDDTPFARSFDDFLDKIAIDPAEFLFEAGCYTRYSDGTTAHQWIPETYLPLS